MIIWKCPKCGNHVIVNEFFCPFCGWEVDGNIEDYLFNPDEKE